MEDFDVVVNDEGFYSCWRRGLPPPLGWSTVGFSGPRDVCLDWIEKVWLDQRPLSLQKRMEAGNPIEAVPEPPKLTDEPDLVDRLCSGNQSVRCEVFGRELSECVAAGMVHLHFSETRGGTMLNVHIIESQWIGSDLQLVGNLTLDLVPVRCEARIDVLTMMGTAKLERMERSLATIA